MVTPRELRAWDDILILIVLGSFDMLGRVSRALGSSSEAKACIGVLVSCNGVEDDVGASVKLGALLAATGVGEVVGVVDVRIAGDFGAFSLLERVIL